MRIPGEAAEENGEQTVQARASLPRPGFDQSKPQGPAFCKDSC